MVLDVAYPFGDLTLSDLLAVSSCELVPNSIPLFDGKRWKLAPLPSGGGGWGNSADVEELKRKVRELTEKVNQNTTKSSKVTELESKIAELTQKINDLQSSGGTNSTKVTELTQKVTQLETKNQQLESKVTDLTQKLTQLTTKVDGIEAKLPFFGSFTMNGTAADHTDTKVTEGTFLSYNITGEVKGQTLDLSVENGKIKAASDASENLTINYMGIKA